MPEYLARVVYRSTYAAETLFVNTFHTRVAVLTDPPNWTNIATDLDTKFTTLYRAIVASNCVVHDLTVTDEDYPGSTLGQGFKSIEAAGTRTASDSFLGGAPCMVVALKSTVTKRYARGRMFMPPIVGSSALASDSSFATANAYYTAITAFMNALIAPWSAGSTDYQTIVYSKRQLEQGLTPYAFNVTNYARSPQMRYLRRRQLGVGA